MGYTYGYYTDDFPYDGYQQKTDNSIFDSIEGYRLDGVKYFINEDIENLSRCNASGDSPLLCAIKSGQLSIVEFLINKYRELDKSETFNENPLSLAIKKKYDNLIDLLLKNKHLIKMNYCDCTGNSPLAQAVTLGNQSIVERLLAEGFDVSQCGKNGKTPLSIAVEKEDINLINLFLDHGAVVNVQSSFLAAIRTINYDIVKMLKEKGAIVNFKYKNGYTPLFKAVATDNVPIVKYLIENGASKKQGDEMVIINVNDFGPCGFTLLTKAIEMINFNMVEILVEGGASVNTRDQNDNHPLRLALKTQSLRIVQYLINKGADISVVQKEIEEYASWNDDFNAFLQSRKSELGELGSDHEGAFP